ncbi:hypothetical protein F4825DRAFT_394115 [Nemania diffusa]|nr:hypothetical protein F4825DRAFT_394115 [Nemania diffusa]
MVKSLETPTTPTTPPKPRPKPRNARFDRIEIWRNEVVASRIYCVCSAPTRQENHCGSSSSTKLSAAGGFYRSVVKLATSVSLEREEWGSRFPSPVLSEQSDISPTYETNGYCPVCASPIDGVVYKRLSTDGSGLVQARNNSPRSPYSGTFLDAGEQVGKDKGKGKLLLKKVSQLLRRTKRLDLPRSIDSVEFIGTSMQQKTYANAPDVPTTTRSTPCIEGLKRTGTEMYHSLRNTTGPGGTANKDAEDETTSAISDDDCKKPKIGIDKSAARLRRAQKMLNNDVRIPPRN